MQECYLFIDESVTKSYLLCMVFVPIENLHETRTTLRKMRLKGQSRIHLKNESDRRRREILNAIVNLNTWNCLLLQTQVRKSNFVEARERLFLVAALTPEFSAVRGITVELSNEFERDKKILATIKRANGTNFEYGFERSSSEECLWIADAVAWAYARGGYAKKQIRSRIRIISTTT